MGVREAYDSWAQQYDTDRNRTRDLEAVALRDALERVPFRSCLEIGCGTGKNTVWLAERATRITAVDLSPGMLAHARAKVTAEHVRFMEADILRPWEFTQELFDLVTFSLMLEHIEELPPIFRAASDHLVPDGNVYVGELHPFKQYAGTKARFATEAGTQVVDCYDHHISEFIHAARSAGLHLVDLNERFDAEGETAPPRILSLVFRKQ